MSFYDSLFEGAVRQLPLFIDFSFDDDVYIPHSFIASNDRLVFLNQFLYFLFHQLLELRFFQGTKDRKFNKILSIRHLIFNGVVAFDLS